VIREVKLVGFLLLLIVIFIGAHAVGSALGPVNAGHSQVSVPAAPGGGGGMTMKPAPVPTMFMGGHRG
jgi:hypothetical protein